MRVLWQLQLLQIANMILFTGAEVSLTIVSPQNATQITGLNVPVNFECDSKITLVCEIKPYIDTAVWQINGTTYAVCLFTTCVTYPPFPDNVNISMDVTSEAFNLTVDPVTVSSNRSIFKCDDGDTAISVDAFVIVHPKNETLKMDTSFANQITVTTGCVYPKGIQDLTFEWFISEDNITINIQGQLPTKVSDSTTVFDCTETSSCAGEETAHFNNTVIYNTYNSGNKYYICVAIKLNDAPNRPSAVICSDQSYIVKSVRECCLHCCCIIVIIYCLRWIQLIQSYFVGASQCELYKVKKVADVSNWYILLFFLECIPIVGGILILVVSVCMKLQEVKPDSWQVRIQVVVGCFPLLGTVYTAFLIWQRKDLCSAARYRILCISWLADIGLFVVMVLACQETLEIPCYCYGILAVICLITAWVNYVCLAECLLELCSPCQQLNIDIMAADKCTDCNEYLCNTCVSDHIERHKKLREKISTNHQEHYMHRESKTFCCEYCQKHVDGYCLTCDRYLCESCVKSNNGQPVHTDHTVLKHIHKKGNTLNRHSVYKNTRVPCKNKNPTSKDGKCERCEQSEQSGEHELRPTVCYCFAYGENMCVHCFEEIRKQSYFREIPLTARRWANSMSCALHSVSELAETTVRRNNADVFCHVCEVFLCTRCFLLHLNLENLWKLQQFDLNFINKPKIKDSKIDHVLRLTDLPVRFIFVGCFPVLGIFGTIKVWRISGRVSGLDTTGMVY